MRRINLLPLGILFICNSLQAITPPLGFIENKGQVQDQDHIRNCKVRYLLNTPGMNVQLKANSFSYDTYTSEQKERDNQTDLPGSKISATQTIYHFHRVDVEFIGANPNPQIIAKGISNEVFNYANIIDNVHSYQYVTYKDLYPGIDLQFTLAGQKMKYNFIVHPGADASQIKWEYKGNFNSRLKNRTIILHHANGNITESIPESYLSSSSAKKTVKVNFKKFSDNSYGFDAKVSPSQGQTLVIDPIPALDWATYYGSGGAEDGNSVHVDGLGFVLMAGNTDSPANIATSGIYQNTIGGNTDAFIAKFDNNGVRQWCTYFGGTGDDYGLSISTGTATGIMYLSGQTTSTSNISTSGTHQTSFGGVYDAFLAKFDGSGTLLWSTYYGGATYESGTAVAVDQSDNAYLIGYTDSPSSIVSGGAFQLTFAGVYDAFAAKFDASGTRLWGTYYGGSQDDYGLTASIDNTGNIYFGGQTASTGMASASAHQTSLGGSYDGFFVKLNTNGVRQWATYYGDVQNDNVYGSATDALGNAYICGQTTSTANIATPGVQQVGYSGGPTDGYIVKFNSTGTRLWGTFYGDAGADVINSAVVDGTGNVFITGTTNSNAGFATTNPYQGTSGGLNDVFLAKLNVSGVRQWGTWYGGTGNDMGNDISTDGTKYFVTGTTASTIGISTGGGFQTTIGAGFDGFLSRFSNGCFNPPAPANTTPTVNLTVCSGKSATLSASGTGTLTWYNAATGGTLLANGPTLATAPLTVAATYYVQDSSVCGASLTRTAISVSITPTPTVSFTLSNGDTLVCSNRNPFNLSVGAPFGGVFSGNGVSTGNVFSPTTAGVGTHVITYMITQSSCTNTATDTIRVKACIGIEEFKSQNNTLSIFPNPGNGQINMSSTIEGKFDLVDELGQIIRTFELNKMNANSTHISNLAAGTYFVCGKNELSYVRKKLVILK